MFAGQITLIIREEDKTGVEQMLEQLTGILHYELHYQKLTVFYDPKSITYEQILKSIVQAGYHISYFF